MKIGVFDSGIGGITVLNALRDRFPSIDYVYLGDTANVPYGPKSPAQIEKLSVDCARKLKEKGIDALVVACNTASSWALPAIREEMGLIPVFGVVGPGVDAVVNHLSDRTIAGETLESHPILILATRATVRSQAYGKKLRDEYEPKGKAVLVHEQACPLLVPMIEEGWVDHPVLHQTIAEYVAPYVSRHSRGVALLGCTHYPWIQAAFEKAMPGWKVLNSAQAVANSLEQKILAGYGEPENGERPPSGAVEWIFTDPDALPDFARKWMRG